MRPRIATATKTPRKSPEYTVDFRRIKIETGLPVPDDAEVLGRRQPGSRSLYPIASLKVGDSFSFPHDPQRESKQWTSINTAIRSYQRSVDPKANFVVRCIRKEGVIRCWRVKSNPRGL